jgi:hypothetical protein
MVTVTGLIEITTEKGAGPPAGGDGGAPLLTATSEIAGMMLVGYGDKSWAVPLVTLLEVLQVELDAPR